MLTKETPLRIERWDPSLHNRSRFDCGVERLNNYLKLTAKKQQKSNIARIYVIRAAGDLRILGYTAINVGSVSGSLLSKASDLPARAKPSHNELPVLFLGQIAIDLTAQNFGVGKILMHHVFEKARLVSETVGCYAVVLDVIADGGVADGGVEEFARRKAWYQAFGFQSFSSNEARMFITIRQIDQIC